MTEPSIPVATMQPIANVVDEVISALVSDGVVPERIVRQPSAGYPS